MIKQMLFLDNKRVDAKAKLVLLAFAVRYQRGETPLIKVEDLAAELKHPAHMVAKAMQDLVGCNLIGEKYSVEGLGRPTRRFRLLLGEDEAMTASVYRDGMEPAAALNLIKKGRVRRPTRNKKEELEVAALEETPEERGIRRRREGRVSYLDASDILLLVALLVLASDRGVVQGVGLTQLASICGVSSVALQGRLKKLVQAGVVRQLVPGIASPLFSKKLKTVVILNLTHEMLGWSQPNQGQVIIHKYNHRMEGEFALVSGLCIDARGAASHQFSQQVLRPFRRAPLHAFGQIEFFLHGLAASVLENLFGKAFGKLEQEETKSFAREHIRGFFRRSSFECGVFDDLVEEMSSLVYQVAVEWSCRIRPHIKGKLLQPKVMIMPGYVRRGYLCIAMMLWGKEREEQSLMIEEHSGMGNQEVCWFECEADIPDEVRVQAGLIQRDKVKNE